MWEAYIYVCIYYVAIIKVDLKKSLRKNLS